MLWELPWQLGYRIASRFLRCELVLYLQVIRFACIGLVPMNFLNDLIIIREEPSLNPASVKAYRFTHVIIIRKNILCTLYFSDYTRDSHTETDNITVLLTLGRWNLLEGRQREQAAMWSRNRMYSSGHIWQSRHFPAEKMRFLSYKQTKNITQQKIY